VLELPKRQTVHAERRGAAAVELAVVAPFLVLIFLGITQFGSLFYTRHSLVHAAREAARELAIQGTSEEAAIAIAEDYLATARVRGATVTAQNAYAGSGDDAASRRVKVTIELPVDDAMILGDSLNMFAPDFKVTAESTMRKEGELAVRPST
jgi:Flp pilus assembly protein TadG